MFRHRSEKVDALATVPLFKGLNKRQLDEVAKLADEVEVQAGKVLVKQGQLAREFFLIVKGRVRVEQDGQEIGHLGDGEYFGEMGLLDGQARSASVIADTDTSLVVVHSTAFGTLIDNVPGFQKAMLRTLARRVREREQALLH
jgi:CRP/FNR family transcriptional regulator, cyclic AMP receptor protein